MSPSCWFCPCREYYFSDENLQKDFFLRRQARSNGLLHQKAFGTRPVWDNTSSMLCPAAHFVGKDQTVPCFYLGSVMSACGISNSLIPRSFNVRFDTCGANRGRPGYQLGIGGRAHSCTALICAKLTNSSAVNIRWILFWKSSFLQIYISLVVPDE